MSALISICLFSLLSPRPVRPDEDWGHGVRGEGVRPRHLLPSQAQSVRFRGQRRPGETRVQAYVVHLYFPSVFLSLLI